MMLKALVIKELREMLGIAAIAAVLYTAFIGSMMGSRLFQALPGTPGPSNALPFLGASFRQNFAWLTSALAIALGFWQTAVESNRGTFPFLLHRPLGRGAIIGAKLGSGLAVLLVEAGTALLVYALWAATPGTHPSPFAWSMAELALQIMFAMTLVYIGAFLSGLRPARWIGTRLLPLAGSCVLAAALVAICWLFGMVGLLLIALCDFFLIVAVLHMARTRDYA
jgi:ABC-type transport system involved in multi-copper enzyme maturation permease subunit